MEAPKNNESNVEYSDTQIDSALDEIVREFGLDLGDPETKAAIDANPILSSLSDEDIEGLVQERLDSVQEGEDMRISDMTDAGQGHLT